jgi:putative nucleotidyltransferase with HDIG domain
MSFQPGVEEQRLLADTFEQSGSGMTSRDRIAEALVATTFVAAVAALWALEPPHSFAVAPALVCLVVLVLATLVRFDTPLGFTVATQLAFVPLLFAMPLAIVPLAVVLALAVARLPEALTGKIRPSRILLVIGNAWFAIGPVAVFVIANTEPRHAGALLLLCALVAEFAVDFTVSTIRLWIAREADFHTQLRDSWVYGIDAALSGIGLVVAEDIHAAPYVTLSLIPLLGLLALFAHERHHRLESLLTLNSAYRGTALVLGDVVEADDGYTGEHCKSVVALAIEVGEHMGLGAEQLRNLEFGALLHDVGKIAIPKAIINKPDKLDPQEWTIIKTHTIEGQKMLDRVGGFMRDVGLIVRSHHERWDGQGYPDGLVGEDIPLEARIIACCDAWNAMQTDRSYRNALPRDAALQELRRHAGSQFDPMVVHTLLSILEPALKAAASPEPSADSRAANRLDRPETGAALPSQA